MKPIAYSPSRPSTSHDMTSLVASSMPSCLCVASAFRGSFGYPDVHLLGVGKRPDFIDLNALTGQVGKLFVLKGGAHRTSVRKQLGDCVLAMPITRVWRRVSIA
ncbi:hypothetical protein ACVWWD_006055 [Mesorhizobium sp. URHB0026]